MRLLILSLIFTLASSLPALTQNEVQDSLSLGSKGGERNGFYIAGGSSIILGTSLGIFSNGFDDYPRSGLPAITGVIGVAPTSLIGIGLGSLFAKKHSPFDRSFQFGIGMTYSSPVFSEFIPNNSYRAGINLRVLSPELGPWRYNLGFNKYFSEVYEFEQIPAYHGHTNLSWWELNLDLQYMIYINDSFKVYPFIGTQYNQVNGPDRKLNTEILANYGFGMSVTVYSSWSLFSEMKYTIDPDDNPANLIYSFGALYSM
jgi:hypothetical protein